LVLPAVYPWFVGKRRESRASGEPALQPQLAE
jgi:cobalt-zinc-cadmium resistance protein CzcA